jgi:hypothetical protein
LVAAEAVAEDNHPRITCLSSNETEVEFLFELPVLAVERLSLDGGEYQSVAIPGGGFEGALGDPGIPTFARFVAIPDNQAVTVTVEREEEEELAGYNLFPIQNDEGVALALNPSSYARDGYGEEPAAAAGSPVLVRNERVVSLILRPVRFDPAHQSIKVSHRLRVRLHFEGPDSTNARASRKPSVPTSFDRMYRSLVVNYDGPRNGVPVESGTWLVICPNDAAVTSRLQPLLDWRQRKGTPVRLATTAQTGSAAQEIKTYIQNAYDNWPIPPEYVVRAGDVTPPYAIPTWFEDVSGFHGEGDNPYTFLEGNDYLSDVHIGRLSFGNLSELEVIVAKIVGYESTPFTQDSTWFTRACLVGDTYGSGCSTVQTMQWIKTRLRQLGYSQIDTIFQGPFVSQMLTALDRGDTFFSYRGYGGMSGWSNTNTSQLTNGWRMPFAVISTCNTGNFAAETSISEGFLRAGSVAAPRGAVAASGTATAGTHTRFNNCFILGVAQGLFHEDLYEMGAAITRGKLELILEYGWSNQYPTARVFAHWNNLVGDPATECWTAFPRSLTVVSPASIPLGSNSLIVGVSQDGAPVPGAQVCVWKGSETYTIGRTGQDGQCELLLTNTTPGNLLLTVTRHNQVPYRATLPVTGDLFVGYESSTVDDDDSGESAGNGDGQVNPGETIELAVGIRNFGVEPVNSVTATITSDDPSVTLTDAEETFGPVGAGTVVWSQDDFGFTVVRDCPSGRILRFSLDATDGLSHWRSLIEVPVVSAELVAAGTTLYGAGNGILDPGETAGLSVVLRNEGGAAANGAAAVLTSLSPWIVISDSLGRYGDIAPGGQRENVGDPFSVTASPEAYPGHLALFHLVTSFNGGTTDTTEVTLTVGTQSSDDPLGPDGHGYYAFDNTDLAYPEAPAFSWVEVGSNPGHGGPGTLVQLGDYGDCQDKSCTVDLPFPFTFYGRTFTRATICSNGWIAMGETYLTDYRNWTIPGAGAPQNLLAVFWDDLRETGNGHVYQWYDPPLHRWIVEWSGLVNAVGNFPETFEAILYDPAFYPTATGDGPIVFQYDEVWNVDDEDGYATVGIQNWNHTDGLVYTYFNWYPPGAITLASGRAIRFVPIVPRDPAAIRETDQATTGPLFRLDQAHPNPSSQEGDIRFTLAHSGQASLTIHDVNGRLLRTLLSGVQDAGSHAVTWDGRNGRGEELPSGTYFVRLTAGDRSEARKVVRLR